MKKRLVSLAVILTMLCAFVPIIPASAAASIKIGDYIQMGEYYGEPILWRCVDIDENGPLILSDKIICLKPFDAETSANSTTGSHSRNDYRSSWGGSSNYWADSNMRSWLNSTASAGNVNWLCGNPPVTRQVVLNGYADEAGFMTHFSQGEINAMKAVSQKSLVSYPEINNNVYTTGSERHTYNYNIADVVQNYDTAYAEYVTDKMFLMDVKQVNAVYNNRATLGDDYYIGEPTAKAVAHTAYKNLEAGEKWYYWLRSPDANHVNSTRCVNSDGDVGSYCYAYSDERGVRPAFYLNLPSFSIKSGSGAASNPYISSASGGGGTDGATNSTSSGAPIITSAKIGSTDIFATKLEVKKDSTENHEVSAAVDANGCTDVHIYICNDKNKKIEIENGKKSIQIGREFSAGEPIYITAVDKKTGKSTSKRTKLSVGGSGMFDGKLSDGAVNILDDFFVDIPAGVPVLEKKKIGLSLGSISSEVEIDGNKFKVSLGSDLLKGKKGADGKWKKEDWEGFKSGFKSAKEKMSKSADAYKYLKNIAPEGTKMEITKGFEGGADASGYIEGYIDGDGLHPTEGGIIIHAELKYKYQGMTLVVVVPVYYEIGAGGEVTAVLGVKDLVAGKGLKGAFTGSVTPAVFFEVGGGVGVPLIFTVGISGKVKAELEIALNKIYQKLDVTGTASFKLTGPFGIPTYNKPFASGTFHVYETGNKNTLLGKAFNMYSADEANMDNPYAQIDIDAPVTVTPHSESTQEWVGGKQDIDLMAVDYTNQEVQILESNSYEDTAPALAEMNGKNVIAWITDNKTRADGDKTMLVYSVEENGAWSAPQPVYDNGFADSDPVMQDGYIVWQKATKNITSDITARDLGKSCEIYMAKWNGSGFDEAVKVTDNAFLDQTPILAVNNDTASVVWMQNSDNNFMGTTGENKIMSYTNGTAKTEVTVSDAVTNISAAYIGGALNIAYETDSDKDLSTLEDREIYNAVNGEINRITNDLYVNTHPIYSDFEGEPTLFYYSDGKIIYLKDGAEKTAIDTGIVTDQFKVISNGDSAAVLWTAVNDGSAELHGALYDGNGWSRDVQISDLGTRIKFPSAMMDSDGKIFAAFNRTQKIPNEYYYDDGQADLCTIKISPSYDIEITDAFFDEENMKAYATVRNIGELAIPSYTVAFSGNNSKTVTEKLNAGDSAEIEIDYNKPENLSPTSIEMAVSIDGKEYNNDNNKTTFDIGHADIIVDNVELDETQNVISADISNNGYDDVRDAVISLRDGSADGAVIETKTVSLDKGAKTSVSFNVDKTSMSFMDSAKPLYITASADVEEISHGNNDGYAIVTSASGYADYTVDTLDYNAVDGKYIINSVAGNNTSSDIFCKIYAAVYSSDGTLKGCGSVDAFIEADDDTGVDITVSCTVEETDVIKTFMWSDTMTPLAKSDEI